MIMTHTTGNEGIKTLKWFLMKADFECPDKEKFQIWTEAELKEYRRFGESKGVAPAYHEIMELTENMKPAADIPENPRIQEVWDSAVKTVRTCDEFAADKERSESLIQILKEKFFEEWKPQPLPADIKGWIEAEADKWSEEEWKKLIDIDFRDALCKAVDFGGNLAYQTYVVPLQKAVKGLVDINKSDDAEWVKMLAEKDSLQSQLTLKEQEI
jgi:hypothetical protein